MKAMLLCVAAVAGVGTAGVGAVVYKQRALAPDQARPAPLVGASTALAQPSPVAPTPLEEATDEAPELPAWHVERPVAPAPPELAAVPDDLFAGTAAPVAATPRPEGHELAAADSAWADEPAPAAADAAWNEPNQVPAESVPAVADPFSAPTSETAFAPADNGAMSEPVEQPGDELAQAPPAEFADPGLTGVDEPTLAAPPADEVLEPAAEFAPEAMEGTTAGPGFATADEASPSTARRRREPALNDDAAAAAFVPETSAGGDPALLGRGRPGERQLEGVQAPVLSVEKLAPAEVQVGAPAVFRIQVRNTGHVAAHDVEVLDEIPAGAELVGTHPQATLGEEGQLSWSLGSLGPGEEAVVELQLVPLDEGELGSVAQVRFSAQASARSRATRPRLALEVTAPGRVMIQERLPLKIRLSNTGTGAAQDVVVQEQLPPGLEHPAGGTLEYEVGRLEPGETRELDLEVTATAAGTIENLILARGAGELAAEAAHTVEVVAPALALSLEGPKRRYLERQATYTVSVSNPGTAPARQVELVTFLPAGLKFVEANNHGEYDPRTRAVRWLLEELPAQEAGQVTLVALPVEPGEQRMVIQGRADQGLEAEQEQVVTVEGLAAILFEVVDVEDPIEVGAETAYEIRVTNQGTKAATQLEVLAQLPEGIEPLAADGPSRHSIEDGRVTFAPLENLPPKAEAVFRLRVRGTRPGDARIRVQVLTAEIQAPITKEESTRIYSDE